MERTTKYTNTVLAYLENYGHGSNAEILADVRTSYPNVSATTIHRITSRMVTRGELTLAPPTIDGAARLDANLTAHDHFQCVKCDCIRDINLPINTISLLQQHLGDCKVTGKLNIQGICANCLKEEHENNCI